MTEVTTWSRRGHARGMSGAAGDTEGALYVRRFTMPRGTRFGRHQHPRHQLAWAVRGILVVTIGDGSWFVPPTRALWIPAGVPHVTEAHNDGLMGSCYLDPAASPVAWTEPTVVAVGPLLRELFVHLGPGNRLDPAARVRAESVLYDLLIPEAAATIDVPLPTDPQAAAVAEALLADPADDRSLEAWGQHVGASGRTLARRFQADLGMGFNEWRTRLRIRAALAHLADGVPVAVVARRVGYRQASAFTASFRRLTGRTPSSYRA